MSPTVVDDKSSLLTEIDTRPIHPDTVFDEKYRRSRSIGGGPLNLTGRSERPLSVGLRKQKTLDDLSHDESSYHFDEDIVRNGLCLLKFF